MVRKQCNYFRDTGLWLIIWRRSTAELTIGMIGMENFNGVGENNLGIVN